MYTFVGNLVVGIVVIAVGAFIAVRLALGRFRAEKWWERRADVYLSLIDSLHYIKELNMRLLAALQGEDVLEDKRGELQGKADAAFEEIRKTAGKSELFLSDKACKVIDAMQKRLAAVMDSQNDSARLQEFVDAIDDCLTQLVPITRRDLALPR